MGKYLFWVLRFARGYADQFQALIGEHDQRFLGFAVRRQFPPAKLYNPDSKNGLERPCDLHAPYTGVLSLWLALMRSPER